MSFNYKLVLGSDYGLMVCVVFSCRGGNVGAIELWDVTHQPYLEKVLLDVEQIDGKASVESLIWVAGRLFSCGLHGFVVEHNVFTGKMKVY